MSYRYHGDIHLWQLMLMSQLRHFENYASEKNLTVIIFSYYSSIGIISLPVIWLQGRVGDGSGQGELGERQE